MNGVHITYRFESCPDFKNKTMKILARALLLLLHLISPVLVVYFFGDFLSKEVDILVFTLAVITYLCLIISIAVHIKNFIIHFKNKNTQL